MESLGILFIYVLFPGIGLFFAVRGWIEYEQNKNKKLIFIGLAFLSIPLLHYFLIGAYQNHYEESVVGKYVISGEREIVLSVNSDNTFELKKCAKLDKYGKGTWAILQEDQLLLVLKLDKDKYQDIYFEVNTKDNIELSDIFSDKKDLKLTKISITGP